MFEEFINPKKLKKEMLQATFFVILYENFKKNWKEEILAFSANEVKFEDHDFLYCFSMPNPDNPNAFNENDFVKDKAMENEFKNEVYRTVKKQNGRDNDEEASLFKWLLDRRFITEEHYNELLDFRLLRNKIVHEFDQLLNGDLPNDMDVKIHKLIKIRKYASKEWFINVEYPTSGEEIYDDNGNVIIPEDAYSNVDLYFDEVYEAIFK